MGIPLTLIKEGTGTSVVRAGGREEVRRRLESMGFIPGVNMAVVSASSGNVIVNVKESRAVINKEVTNRIMV